MARTRRERLAELLGLVGVGQAEGVQVARATDLELVLGLRDTRSANLAIGRLLDGRGCRGEVMSASCQAFHNTDRERTLSVLSASDLEELLDLLDLLRL